MTFIRFLVLLLLSTSAMAQTEITTSLQYIDTALVEVLSDIENRYDVKFSYNPEVVDNVIINLEVQDAMLSEILKLISERALIDFNNIDDRYYSIKRAAFINVCGYLIDAKNGLPIHNATIINATSNAQGSVTDSRGFFNLKSIDRSHKITISYLGYKSITIALNSLKNNSCKTYYLSDDEVGIDEVILKAYLGNGMKMLINGAIKIKPNNLETLSGLSEPDILQSVQLLPGIESPSETASGIYMRGGTPDQNLILWDGIKMYNSDHFFGMFSAFNPYIVEDVTVYRSGVAPKYGDRVSGVIDIRTDNEVPDSTQASVGLNLVHMDAYIKQPLSKKAGLIISGRRSITDFIDTPAFDSFSEKVFQATNITVNQEFFSNIPSNTKEDFYFGDLTAKLILEPTAKDRISISGITTNNDLDYRFNTTLGDGISTDRLKIKNTGVNALWTSVLNSNLTLKTNGYYSIYNLDFKNSEQFIGFTQSVAKENTVKELGVSFNIDWKVNDQISIDNGYQFVANNTSFLLQSIESTSRASTANVHTLFSQLSYKIPDAYLINIGARVNYIDAIKSLSLEPRLYMEYRVSTNFRAKASAERRTQSISQIIEFETAGFGLENQVWVLTDNDVTPVLKSNQYSAGFLIKNKGWKLDTDLYYKRVNGLTSFTRGFQLSSNDFENGESKTFGVDILVKKKLGNYTTWLGYTYSDTDFVFDNLNNGNPFSGNNDSTHSVTWSHFFKWKHFQFSAGWKFRTGTPYTKPIGVEDEIINFGSLNNNRLDNYHRLDLSAIYNFKFPITKKTFYTTLGVSVLNVYNTTNILNKDFFLLTDEMGDTLIKETRINSLGLTPTAFFRLRF